MLLTCCSVAVYKWLFGESPNARNCFFSTNDKKSIMLRSTRAVIHKVAPEQHVRAFNGTAAGYITFGCVTNAAMLHLTAGTQHQLQTYRKTTAPLPYAIAFSSHVREAPQQANQRLFITLCCSVALRERAPSYRRTHILQLIVCSGS